MAVRILTVRVFDQFGQVRDVRQVPFLVLGDGEDADGAERELLDMASQLERVAQQIAEARFDPQHRHHHWWLP